MLAYRDLEESYYAEWAAQLHRANAASEGREERLARLYEEVENDMMVIAGWGG